MSLEHSPSVNWRTRAQRLRLEGNRCSQCNSPLFPPRPICPHCQSSEQKESFAFAGKGKVYAFTTPTHGHTTPEFDTQTPHLVIALIQLDEGPMITAQLTDLNWHKENWFITEKEEEVELPNVEIGMPVEVVVRKIKENRNDEAIVYGYKFRPSILSSK